MSACSLRKMWSVQDIIVAVHPFTSVPSQTWRHLKCVKCFELKKSQENHQWSIIGKQMVSRVLKISSPTRKLELWPALQYAGTLGKQKSVLHLSCPHGKLSHHWWIHPLTICSNRSSKCLFRFSRSESQRPERLIRRTYSEATDSPGPR